jgi:hypothetical protein
VKVKSSRWYKELLVGLLSVGAIALYGNISPVQSQIVPDDTLDEESSRVTPDVEINGVKSDRIDGGATQPEEGIYFTASASLMLMKEKVLILLTQWELKTFNLR